MKFTALLLALLLLAPTARAAEPAAPPIRIGADFPAADTLNCGDEPVGDARACLDNLSWEPEKFTVTLEATERGCGDYLVRFPSARPIGDTKIDVVSMEWFPAKDANKQLLKAPAIVVVHESGRNMIVGRLIARGLGAKGIHAFLLHLPGYGARRVPGFPKLEQIIPAMHAAVADIRRAHDAVAALPVVDSSSIGLQGTSLGGFLTATTAGLDHSYNRVFIVLAGGDLRAVFENGAKEIEKSRAKLAAEGITDVQILDVARELEPLRVAHRLNPAETWLYSGEFDQVVPRKCSLALAKAAHLPDGHHIEFPANHYTAAIYIPTLVDQMAEHLKSTIPSPTP